MRTHLRGHGVIRQDKGRTYLRTHPLFVHSTDACVPAGGRLLDGFSKASFRCPKAIRFHRKERNSSAFVRRSTRLLMRFHSQALKSTVGHRNDALENPGRSLSHLKRYASLGKNRLFGVCIGLKELNAAWGLTWDGRRQRLQCATALHRPCVGGSTTDQLNNGPHVPVTSPPAAERRAGRLRERERVVPSLSVIAPLEKGMSPISARIVARDDNTTRAEIGLIPFSATSNLLEGHQQ